VVARTWNDGSGPEPEFGRVGVRGPSASSTCALGIAGMVEPRRQREGRERHRLRFLAQDLPRVEVRRGCGMWVFFCVQRSHQIRQSCNLGAPRVGGRRRRDARRMGPTISPRKRCRGRRTSPPTPRPG
jgi:hypothetical protein